MNIIHALTHFFVGSYVANKQIDDELIGQAHGVMQRARSFRHRIERQIEQEQFIDDVLDGRR